jgi:hypothetical protein
VASSTHPAAGDGLFVSGYLADQSDRVDALSGDISNPVDSLTITSANPACYRGTVCASFSIAPPNL